MSEWHGEIYDEIEKLAKSGCTVEAGMSAVVEQCARYRPHPDWEQFGALGIADDLRHLRGWLAKSFFPAPEGDISGLWFGLHHPAYDGRGTTDIWLSGSPYDPDDPDWACAMSWEPDVPGARSRVLQDIFDISYGPDGLSYGDEGFEARKRRFLMNDGEYPLCLAYAALAVRSLAADLDPRVLLDEAPRRLLFAGWNSGDYICIGELSAGGLEFSRDSFDWHAEA